MRTVRTLISGSPYSARGYSDLFAERQRRGNSRKQPVQYLPAQNGIPFPLPFHRSEQCKRTAEAVLWKQRGYEDSFACRKRNHCDLSPSGSGKIKQERRLPLLSVTSLPGSSLPVLPRLSWTDGSPDWRPFLFRSVLRYPHPGFPAGGRELPPL